MAIPRPTAWCWYRASGQRFPNPPGNLWFGRDLVCIEEIHKKIDCNICITGDMAMSISRCTQNPTFMEEWRKGSHPERML